jgi:hypothetical protein
LGPLFYWAPAREPNGLRRIVSEISNGCSNGDILAIRTDVKRQSSLVVKSHINIGSGTKIMNFQAAARDTSVSTQLRPIVILVAVISFAVASLLITTATLGASPIRSMEVAQLD